MGDNSFTIFDAMEKKGYFRHNPANFGATDPITKEVIYKGPVAYPRMLYHPKGEVRQTHPGEDVSTPFGPKHVNEHFELVNVVVHSAEEEAKFIAEGWHDRPWKAMKAGGADMSKIEAAIRAAPMSETQKDRRIAELEAMLAAQGIATPASDSVSINGQEIASVNKLLAATRPTEELLAEAEAKKLREKLQAKGLVEADEDE